MWHFDFGCVVNGRWQTLQKNINKRDKRRAGEVTRKLSTYLSENFSKTGDRKRFWLGGKGRQAGIPEIVAQENARRRT
jgi:hypothetical protein